MENKVESEHAERFGNKGQPETSAGGWGHRHFETATGVLSEEHRVIERVLRVLDKLTQAPVEATLDSWTKAIQFIRGFADQCHHLKEEKILFPALEERGIPREGGPIGVMLMEHEEGRGYVRSMTAALALAEKNKEGAQDALLTNAKSYLRLLKEHIQKEDEVLFKIADEVIPETEQKAIVRAFEEHEAEAMGTGVHEQYLRLVQELEQANP